MANLMLYADAVIHEGYLLKQSQYLQALRKRWIIIKGKYLLCYKEKQIYSNPTEIFDLSIYNKTKKLSNTEFEIQSTTKVKKPEKKRKFVTNNNTETEEWINYILAIQLSKNADNHLNLPPTTSILTVFQTITQCVGINDDDNKMSMPYINKLNEKWYCRAIDLSRKLNKEMLNELKMPTILHNEIFKFVENSKQNDAYIHFKEATDRRPIDISMTICTKLSNDLFAEKHRIKNDLQPLFDYNFNRLYHLSKISDDLYNKLLSKAPTYLKKYLYDIITEVRRYKTLPFYRYDQRHNKLEEINIDWTMRTEEVFEILEQDLNLVKGELYRDRNLLMRNFYSNLWDWFFIPNEFWKRLRYYNTFETVRIRIYELMSKLVKKYNIDENKAMPCLPEQWLKKYDPNLSVDQLLYGGDKTQFTFDGLNWNKDTIKNRELIKQYMHKNYVGKLQLITGEHCNNSDTWSRYMNDNQIPSHIRFKINFYSIAGNIQTDDDWLNDYINKNYPNLPPQYVQDTLPVSTFSIEDIASDSASIRFSMAMDMKCDHDIAIEISYDNEKKAKWFDLVTLSDQTSYLCKNLRANTKYQIRARYKSDSMLGPYSIKSFSTLSILTGVQFLKLREMVNKHTKNAYEKDWNLLYQGSNGISLKSFYNKCDKKRNIIFIIQDEYNDRVFGGFTSIQLDKTKAIKINKRNFENDTKAFIYLFNNVKWDKPVIFPINKQGKDAIRTDISNGSISVFGFGGSQNTRIYWYMDVFVQMIITSKGKSPYKVPNSFWDMHGNRKEKYICCTAKKIEVFELIEKTM